MTEYPGLRRTHEDVHGEDVGKALTEVSVGELFIARESRPVCGRPGPLPAPGRGEASLQIKIPEIFCNSNTLQTLALAHSSSGQT